MPIQPRITDEEFQDIRIIDLDLSRTTWSRVHETLRVMFLRLDRPPPDTDWSRLFFEERDTRIVARRRGLWIEENYISFDSLPDEVDKIHLPDIRLSLAYANRKYRELALERRLKRQEEQAGQRSERDEMLALRARVRGILDVPAGAAAQDAAAPVPAARTAAAAAARIAVAPDVTAVPVVAPAAAAAVAAKPAAATPMVAKAAAAAAAAAAASEAARSVAAAIAARAAARTAATPTRTAVAPPSDSSTATNTSAAAAPAVETTPAAAEGKTQPATDPAPAAAPAADALAEFRLRRDALKQRFRHAAAPQDKEQNNGND
ncbi:hypothetical protein [Tahibacter harae]|uniref:Uncharacterized protein n=1 Tax=Tahibacter harae TaxID=2963937 RepID=A0ABT1QP65_9GAMM|nr:hypothetical protein [Tahibacter harae]MCQ4164012.1 hypothetical protein [Tahibacter harae]